MPYLAPTKIGHYLFMQERFRIINPKPHLSYRSEWNLLPGPVKGPGRSGLTPNAYICSFTGREDENFSADLVGIGIEVTFRGDGIDTGQRGHHSPTMAQYQSLRCEVMGIDGSLLDESP